MFLKVVYSVHTSYKLVTGKTEERAQINGFIKNGVIFTALSFV